MGVPKFYRWISERYPKINQIVSDSMLLPEFDNLYLDMNGILHTCTHPNDDGLSAQLSERDIILGIFHYIDRIVTHIVRPRRVLYMAIDGVAPRAKMNQQRSRRFRARKDMQEAKLIAESKGEVVDDGAVFDSNCITPGTEFMAKISRHLRYFIQKKITEDPLWKSLTVTFSGHEVPGEGEHKIMAYIRDERSSGRLPPNTRHCMYGQDADLILLGLVTHEPHFTLLREVVEFGSNASKGKNASKVVVKTTRDACFQLLHLSILREYVWTEFTRGLQEETVADMDCERVVDDFVFLTFLVGNDFLPHMPSLDIGEEAFSLLFSIYRSLKPGWGDGYLTQEGTVSDPARLEQFLAVVGAREDDIFADRAEEEAEFRGRRRRTSKRFGRPEEIPSEAEIALEEARLQQTYEKAMMDTMGYVPEPQDGEKDYKGRYYFEKFGITPLHTEIHDRLRAAYVEGLLWCLAYYYRGCVSWGWFFPFHYVPMISDLTGLRKTFDEVKFELGEPFLPFEQLLGCLPGASANFLPASYAKLMLSPESPIIDFYPEDFEIDMNGKRNPWEAVNVLPFIDAYRLRAAVKEHCPPKALTFDEIERNTRGQVVEYYNDPSVSRKELSCNPEIGLADITQCSASFRIVPFSIEPGECFRPELPHDTIIPSAGFPSLHVLPVGSVEERKVPVNVFGTASRYETIVLQLKRPPQLPPASALANKVLGRSAYVNWPLMHEAQVVGISDENEEYRLKEVKGKRKVDVKIWTKEERDRWRLRAAEEQGYYVTGRGVPGSGGVDIGTLQLMLKARPLQGMRVDPKTGARRKVFGKEEAEVPVHMVLWSCPSEDPRFQERENLTLEDRFPVGSRLMCLHGGIGHGCGGEVVGYSGTKVDVKVDLRPPEPPFGLAIVQSIKVNYFPQHKASAHLGIAPQVFGRIVGSLIVEPGKFDLGLNLKQNHRYQLPEYSRCVLRKGSAWSTSDTVRVVGSAPEDEVEESSWEFSMEAIKLIARYKRTFPQLFHALSRHGANGFFEANTLLGPGGRSKVEEIAVWLQNLETANLQRVPLTTTALPKEAVKAVERGADVRQAVLVKNAMIKKTVMKGLDPSNLLAYDIADHTDAPMDTGAEMPDLGDRVVNMRARGVPFGMWGTVVAIHSHSACVEVVFDEEFIGGSTLHGMCSNYRGALVPWATVAKIHTKARLQALRAGAGGASAGAAGASSVSASTAKPKQKAAPATHGNVSILRPSRSSTAAGNAAPLPSNTNKSGGVNVTSTHVLKGALGIGISEQSSALSSTPSTTTTRNTTITTGGPQPLPSSNTWTSVPASTKTAATGAPAAAGGREGTSAAAAAAGAVLKGMLGMGVGNREGAKSSVVEPNVRVAGETEGGNRVGVNLVRTQDTLKGFLLSPSAINSGSIEATKRRESSASAATVSTAAAETIRSSRSATNSAATADLKAMIGVGLGLKLARSPASVNPPSNPTRASAQQFPSAFAGEGNEQTASVGVHGKEAVTGGVVGGSAKGEGADGRTVTPPPPARVGGVGSGGRGTPSAAGRGHPVLSPDRRGASGVQFRQAKGPDKTGFGFREGRSARFAGRGRRAASSRTATMSPVATAAESANELQGAADDTRLNGQPTGVGDAGEGGTGKRGGAREVGATGVGGDEAVRARVVAAQAKALAQVQADGRARDKEKTRLSGEEIEALVTSERLTSSPTNMRSATTSTMAAAATVIAAGTTVMSTAEQLMSMIGAKRPAPSPTRISAAASGSILPPPPPPPPPAAPCMPTAREGVGPDPPTPGANASSDGKSSTVIPGVVAQNHPGVPRGIPDGIIGYPAGGVHMFVGPGGVPFQPQPAVLHGSMMGPPPAGVAGDVQQRAVWQQQRMLEMIQQQQRHHQQQQQIMLHHQQQLQHQHHQQLLLQQQQQQQHHQQAAYGGHTPHGGVFPMALPAGPPVPIPGGTVLQAPVLYHPYGYQQGGMQPHVQPMARGYPSSSTQAQTSPPAACHTPSTTIPRKPRKSSVDQQKTTKTKEGGVSAGGLMIPSSALLAARPRKISAAKPEDTDASSNGVPPPVVVAEESTINIGDVGGERGVPPR